MSFHYTQSQLGHKTSWTTPLIPIELQISPDQTQGLKFEINTQPGG